MMQVRVTDQGGTVALMTVQQPPSVDAIVGLRREGGDLIVIDSSGQQHSAHDPPTLWSVLHSLCNGEEPPTMDATFVPNATMPGGVQGEAIKDFFVGKMKEQYGDAATTMALKVGSAVVNKLRSVSRKGGSRRWDDKKHGPR